MSKLLHALGKAFLKSYDVSHVLCFETNREAVVTGYERPDVEFRCMSAVQLREFADEAVLEQLWWGKDAAESIGHVALMNDRAAAVAWSWTNVECVRRGDWKIDPRDVFLVEMFVSPHFRGKKLSPALYKFAMDDLSKRGYRRIYGRAWYNHEATLRTLYKLGWQRIATTVEAKPIFGPMVRFVVPKNRELLPMAFWR